jgi:hypothetical protein
MITDFENNFILGFNLWKEEFEQRLIGTLYALMIWFWLLLVIRLNIHLSFQMITVPLLLRK